MKTVLWLAANPLTTGRLDFEEEAARVAGELTAARYRDQIEFRQMSAVTAFDIVHCIRQ